MGKTNHYELKIDHERFLDYSFSDSKSNFLDIWLFSNSSGIISTGSGPDVLGAIYDIPILFLNSLPLSAIWVSANLLRIPKRLRRINTGKELTLAETLASSFQTTKEYELSGIQIIDLNSREIVDGIQEFWGRITGTWIENQKDELLQTEFWALCKRLSGNLKDHDLKHPEARVGSTWLRSLGSEFLA
jgi:putative glycosyltransferase (TIGR04372 family)